MAVRAKERLFLLYCEKNIIFSTGNLQMHSSTRCLFTINACFFNVVLKYCHYVQKIFPLDN